MKNAAYEGEFTVIVHEDSGQSIDQMFNISEEGAVDLGTFSDTLSVTIAYRYPLRIRFGSDTQELNQVALQSYIDLPLTDIRQENGQYALRLPVQGAFTRVESISQDLTVLIDVSELPPPQSSNQLPYVSKLQPLHAFNARGDCHTVVVDGRANHIDVDLYEHQAQSDGSVSFLSLITGRTDSEIQRYGYVLDRALADRDDITINANRLPEPVIVESVGFPALLPDGSDRENNVSRIAVYGERGGINYALSNRTVVWQQIPDFSGAFFVVDCNTPRLQAFPATLKVAAEFPVDRYFIEQTTSSFSFVDPLAPRFTASGRLNAIQHSCTSIETTAQRPSQLVVNAPTMSYTDLSYDPNRGPTRPLRDSTARLSRLNSIPPPLC